MNEHRQNDGHAVSSEGADVEQAAGETDQLFKYSNKPKRLKIVLVFCYLANFLSASANSLLGPFYPLEATKKGMSLTTIGVVFSMYQLVVFLTSPVLGTYMTRIGLKFNYLSGVFVGGCCAILFGLLDKGPGGTTFVVISILVRAVEALGFSAFMTACMTIVTNEFPDHVGSVVATLKIGSGLGFMVGPVIGGLLYDLGGYGLPFYTVGVLCLLNGAAMYVCLPDIQDNSSKTDHKLSFVDLLRSPVVMFSVLVVFFALAGLNFMFTSLSEHLKQFDLTASEIGGLYAMTASLFLIISYVAGRIVDHNMDLPLVLIIFGHFIGFVSWMLNGPSPLLPFVPASLWCVVVGLVLYGVSFGCMQVPAMACMVRGASDLNYEKNLKTLALVSGIFNSAFALGGFTGPLVGGAIIEVYGFPNGYTMAGLVNLFMFLCSAGFFYIDREKRQKQKRCSYNDGYN